MSPPIAGQPRAQAVIHLTNLAALRIEIHEATYGHEDRGGKLHPGQRLIEARVSTDLTRQIGDNTGSDVSLYARGWVYVDTKSSSGASAAQIIGIVLVLLIVVGMVVMLAAGAGDGASGAAKALAHTGKAGGQERAGDGACDDPRAAGCGRGGCTCRSGVSGALHALRWPAAAGWA
jgi:hypothetical protein